MAHSRSKWLAVVGLLAPMFVCSAQAGEWDIVLNGKAIHLDADKDWNESNWGLGFEHEFNPESRWVRLVLANGFVDSDDAMSYMAGGGIKRRFRLPIGERRLHMDLGAVGFFMTRHDVGNNEPFPGILPAFSVGSRSVSVNMTYLPGQIAEQVAHARTADPNLDGILFIQFKVNSRLFRPGSRGKAVRKAANTTE